MYEAGADYVYLSRLETAVNLVPALDAAFSGKIKSFRASQDHRFACRQDRKSSRSAKLSVPSTGDYTIEADSPYLVGREATPCAMVRVVSEGN